MGMKREDFFTNSLMCNCLDYQLCGLGYNKSEKVICCRCCLSYDGCDIACKNEPIKCNGAYWGRHSNERIYVFETYHHKRYFLGTDEVKEFFGCSKNHVYNMLVTEYVNAPSGAKGRLYLL